MSPWVLGLAGLVPFVGFAIGAALAPPPYGGVSIAGYYAYGAVILSFLGGTRWGFEIGARPDAPQFFVLAGAVVPSLMGWFAVLSQLVAPELGLATLAVGFVVMWVWDLASSGHGGRRFPHWYPPLRTVLTLGALLSGGALYWVMRTQG
jgi:Protein of unknown function (DUF3429)